MKTLKGSLTLTRPWGADGDGEIRIKLTDEEAGVRVVEVRITLEQFADLLTNRSNVPCDFDFNDSKLVGLKRETKYVEVPFPRFLSPTDSSIDKALKNYEVDGWQANRSDFKNPHRWCGTHENTRVNVLFQRWIPK